MGLRSGHGFWACLSVALARQLPKPPKNPQTTPPLHPQLGRLEVGSETPVDASKSIKSHLMVLLEEAGNTDVEVCVCVWWWGGEDGAHGCGGRDE